jgi:hypothetical protein
MSTCQPPEFERRASQRTALAVTAQIEPVSGKGPRLMSQVIDVSAGGIRMAVPCRLEPGSTIRIDLPGRSLGPVTTVLACVVRTAPLKDGVWSVGCTFCSELNDEELQSLHIQREEPLRRKDMRQWIRQPTRARIQFRNLNTATETLFRAELVNASPSGVGLRVKIPLMPGSLLELIIQNPEGETLLTIVGCVVYRRPENRDEYLVGCNFVRELNEEELRALS